MMGRPPRSTLFPYTPLFRSDDLHGGRWRGGHPAGTDRQSATEPGGEPVEIAELRPPERRRLQIRHRPGSRPAGGDLVAVDPGRRRPVSRAHYAEADWFRGFCSISGIRNLTAHPWRTLRTDPAISSRKRSGAKRAAFRKSSPFSHGRWNARWIASATAGTDWSWKNSAV